MTDEASRRNSHRWSWLLGGVILFGLLMGVREEFHSMWLRALVAGCAFIVLGIPISFFRRVRD